MYVNTLIVGAGPGGLACAKTLADHGVDTLILERNRTIGSKVCAGGITWSGLIRRVPATLAEQSFPKQYIQTPLQNICIQEKTPIIATVNREKLGAHMKSLALKAGAKLRSNVFVRTVKKQSVHFIDRENKTEETIRFENLVGADGSNSTVRRFLGLRNTCCGVGINYQIPGNSTKMEWHLNNRLFGNGYAWIFPHTKTLSIGAYADKKTMSSGKLKENLIDWAHTLGHDLNPHPAKAGLINFDYQGWKFNHIFLVGDAAGLASGLTGEGIYPAIVSGEQVAHTIANPTHDTGIMDILIHKHNQHRKILTISNKSAILNSVLAELAVLGLRSGAIPFSKLEMAI